jgi:ribonuclease HI
MIIVYTDGSCRGIGGGPGGWAFHAEDTETSEKELVAGGLTWTTNNAAELWAVYHALLHLPAGKNLLIVTDSRNMIKWLTGKWARRAEHINDLCLAIETAKKEKQIKWAFKKVKGHAHSDRNNMVDQAAFNEATKILRQQ